MAAERLEMVRHPRPATSGAEHCAAARPGHPARPFVRHACVHDCRLPGGDRPQPLPAGRPQRGVPSRLVQRERNGGLSAPVAAHPRVALPCQSRTDGQLLRVQPGLEAAGYRGQHRSCLPRGGRPREPGRRSWDVAKGLDLPASQPLPPVLRRRLGSDRSHRRVSRPGGAGPSLGTTMDRVGRGAGARRLFQTDRRAHPARRPRLPRGPLSMAGATLRGPLSRLRIRLLPAAVLPARLEPARGPPRERPLHHERLDVVHGRRPAPSRSCWDTGGCSVWRGSPPWQRRPRCRYGGESATSRTW